MEKCCFSGVANIGLSLLTIALIIRDHFENLHPKDPLLSLLTGYSINKRPNEKV